MPRTVTRDQSSFQRSNVTYAFSAGSKANVTTITVPPNSDWTSGLHWHETHREFLNIVQGSALVTVGSETRCLSKLDGLITIEQHVLHEWKRNPENSEPLIVEEWTDPADGQKELFFRNLCSSILDITANPSRAPPPIGINLDWWITLQLLMIFREYDNYPVIYSGFMARPITYISLFIMTILGKILGLQANYREYTYTKADSKVKDN
jgi:mannose-6-phosphate isomerase-like protein (cupin superfamily)